MTTIVAVVTISEDLIEYSCDEARTQNYLSSTQGVLISHMSNLQNLLDNKCMSKNNSNPKVLCLYACHCRRCYRRGRFD